MADGDLLSITALVGLGGLALATLKLYLDLRTERQRSNVAMSQLQVDTKKASSIELLASAQTQQGAELKKLVGSLTNVVKTYEGELESLRREVAVLRREAGSGAAVQSALVEVERQKLEQRKREVEWRKARDIARGLGWLLDRMSTEDESDNDEDS